MNFLSFFIGKKIIGQIIPMALNQRKSMVEEQPTLIKLPDHSHAFSEVTGNTQASLHAYEQIAMKIAQSAIADGTRGEPAEDSTGSPAESRIDYECQAALDDVSLTIATARTLLKKKRDALTVALQDGSIEQAQQDRTRLKKRADLHDAESKARGISALQETLRQLEEKKQHVDARFQTLLLNIYKNVPPARRLIDYPLAFTGFIAFMFLVEFSANFTAFQKIDIGGNNFGALVIGFFFTLFQTLSAKGLGKAIHDQNKPKRVFFAITTFLFCLVICITRVSMGEENIFLKGFYVLVNVIIAGSTVFVAYAYAQNRGFFAELRERNRLARQIEQIRRRIEQREADHENRIETIEERYQVDNDRQIHAEKTTLQRQITQIETELTRLDSEEQKCGRTLASLRRLALEEYQRLNSSARKDNGHAPVRRWQQNFGNDDFSFMKKVSVLLLCCASFLMSCNTPPATHVEVLYDQTDGTNVQDPQAMLVCIMGYIEDEVESGNWGEVTVTLSQIGETSTQFTRTVTLPVSEFFIWRNENEHKKRPEQFKQELKAALDSLTQPAKELDYSYIDRNFYYRLKALSEMQGRRVVLSWSDLILNSKEINFYHYRKQPDQIMLHRDSLIEVMTRKYPLPNLDGISLVNFHQPDKVNDELHETAKRFFGYYWESLDMDVEFKSTLPFKDTALSDQVR